MTKEYKLGENTEEWFEIPGFPKYMITRSGKVKVVARTINRPRYVPVKERVIAQQLMRGYMHVNMHSNAPELPRRMQVHRLLALTFIPNPENKPCVNHINHIRSDNRLENLEWCTYLENAQAAHRFGRYKRKPSTCIKMKAVVKTRVVLNLQSGIFHYSMNEAAECYGIGVDKLRFMLNGKVKNKTYLIAFPIDENMNQTIRKLYERV